MKRGLTLGLFLVVVLISLWCVSSVSATDYYVNATTGNDSLAGTSPATAWKTISKVNGETFNASDNIYFERGEEWRERLDVPSSGNSSGPITFGAYGSGNAPKILRSVAKNDVGDWTNEAGNLWYTASATEIINLIYNSEASEATMVELKASLDTQGEAWYDNPNNSIYIYSVGNPATVYNGSIEVVLLDHAIDVNDKAYITIDGFDIRYTGDDAIYANYVATGSNLIVQNCNFKFIASNLFGDTHFHGRSIHIIQYTNSSILNNTFEYTATAVNPRSNGVACVITIDGNTASNHHGADWNTDSITFGGTAISDWNGSVVSNNDVSGFRDDGIDLFYASNVVVRNNVVHDIAAGTTGDGNGIKAGGIKNGTHSTGNQIIRNLIYNINEGSHKTAIHGNGCENVLVAYNIMHNCRNGFVDGALDANGACDNPQIYNNVIHNMSNIGIVINMGIDTDNRKTATIANNICDGDVRDISVANWVDCGGGHNCLVNDASVFEGANANYTGTNDLGLTDPLFVNAANNDFRLQSNSLCIDAGTDVGLTQDYNGISVPQGSAPDIGAYEYQYTVVNGGDGGGSGGGSTSNPTQEQLEETYEKILYKNWKINFEFNNENHTIELNDIVNETAIITVSSQNQTFNLTINETKKLNLDDDNYYDLSIKLKDITGYRADLIVKLIHEEIPEEEPEEDEDDLEEKVKWWLWLVLALIVVFLVIIIIVMYKHKKKKATNFSKLDYVERTEPNNRNL